MSYYSTYKGSEVDESIRHTLTPDLFGYNANDDVSDDIIVGTVDTYQVFIPDPLHLDSFMTDEFSYNAVTGEITYLGEGELYSLTGNVSLASSVVNTIMHFAVFVNGAIAFESSAKAESITAIISLGLSAMFNLVENDIVTIRVKADKVCTVSAYHAQGFIHEVQPSLG